MLHVSLRHCSDSLTGIGAAPLDDLQMLLNRLDFPALRLEKSLGATCPARLRRARLILVRRRAGASGAGAGPYPS
jgi:hypothetical protein